MNSKKKKVTPNEIVIGNLYSVAVQDPAEETSLRWPEAYQNLIAIQKDDLPGLGKRGEWHFINKDGRRFKFSHYSKWCSFLKKWLTHWSYESTVVEESMEENIEEGA